MAKKSGKIILLSIISGGIGLISGLLGVRWMKSLGQENSFNWTVILFIICACVLSYFLTIIIHEAGHLVTGLLTGYEFVSFRIGSFTVMREDGKLVRRKFHIPGTGGQCILTHKAVENPQDIPYFWYHFGGVFFNFLTTVLCLPVLFLSQNQFVLCAFYLLAVLSFFIGIFNILPTKTAGIGTDGYNLLLLKKSPVDRIAIYKMLRINALQYQGVRLEDMPDELLNFSESEKDCVFGISLVTIEAGLLMYRHDFKKAEEEFRLVAENDDTILLYKNECTCEMMFCMMMNNCPSEEIEKVYTKPLMQYIKATEKYYIMRKRLMYTYYLVIKKDNEKAKEEYTAALEMERTYPAKGEFLSELSLMNYVRDNFS